MLSKRPSEILHIVTTFFECTQKLNVYIRPPWSTCRLDIVRRHPSFRGSFYNSAMGYSLRSDTKNVQESSFKDKGN